MNCVECNETEFDQNLYCLHCGRRNYLKKCPTCKGSGWTNKYYRGKCRDCSGTGIELTPTPPRSNASG